MADPTWRPIKPTIWAANTLIDWPTELKSGKALDPYLVWALVGSKVEDKADRPPAPEPLLTILIEFTNQRAASRAVGGSQGPDPDPEQLRLTHGFAGQYLFSTANRNLEHPDIVSVSCRLMCV